MLVYNEDYLIVLEYIMLYKKFIFIFLFFIKKFMMMFNLNVRYYNGNVMWSL